MKKISLLTAFICGCFFCAHSQAHFGVQVGGNVAITQYERNEDDDLTNKPRFGLVAGLVADVPLGPVSFRPELNFIQKGFKNEDTNTDLGVTTVTVQKSRFNYVEVPLNFVFNVPVGASKIYFGLGPNFGLGMGGNVEYKATASSVLGTAQSSTKFDVRFDGKENDLNSFDDRKYHLKRLDFGGNVLAGFQSSMGLFVNLGFTLGLSDISPNSSDTDNFEFQQKNHGVHLKIGYMFGCGSDKKSKTTSGGSATGGSF